MVAFPADHEGRSRASDADNLCSGPHTGVAQSFHSDDHYICATVNRAGHPAHASKRWSSGQLSRLIVVPLVVAAAVGGALAGCHPTGTPVVDPLETAAFAAGFTLVISRAAPGTWLVAGVIAVLLARGWLLVPAGAAALSSGVGAFATRSRRRAGDVSGALVVQVVLRWPPALFHGFPTVAAAALVAICAISAWGRSSRPVRRRTTRLVGGLIGVALAVSIPLVIASLATRPEVLRGQAAASMALANVGSANTASVVKDLGEAAANTSNAARAVGNWITAGARAVPVLAQQERFLVGTLRAASAAAATGRRQAGAIDYRPAYQPGQVDLARLRAVAAPMRILDRQLHRTDRQLAGLDSSWLVAPLQDRASSYRRQLIRATRSADLGVQAARVLPGMLGGSGARHYLVAFMTPAESRGYDGLIASYGVLSAEAGHISLTTSASTVVLGQALPAGGAKITGVPDYMARYGAFDPGRFPEDVSYSPDLPTDADVFTQLYAQSGGGPIDGVLALDPYGLAALLHFAGPINVAGLPYPLTEANAAAVLLTREYATFDTGQANQDAIRHAILQTAVQAAFHSLVDKSLPAPKELSAVLDPMVIAGRISFWSFHRDEQPFLRQLGIDGSFPQVNGGDLLAVTAQNTGNNKIDAYLHTSIADHVTFDPGTGAVHSVARISLTNDAPSTGLPPNVIDSPADPGLAPGTNETWLTLYSPLSLTRVTVDGTPATMSAMRELGVWAYSTYVQVAPRTSVTVRVDLTGTVVAGSTFRMSVRLQPLANPERAQVFVTPTGPWNLATSNDPAEWDLGPAMRQTKAFRFVAK